MVSRSQIASATGLARSTVSTLVGELQRAGLVVEREDVQAASAASGGRPPLMLSLDPGAGAVIGIQFDHDFVRVAIADLSLTILAEGARQADVDHDAHAGLSTAAELVDCLLADAGVERERLVGAGVALSGPIDRATGQVSSSTILPGWVGIDVGSWLSERLGVRVEVDNDANLGALAESVLGAGRDATEMAYVMLSSGIGGGLILGGRLYRGARGMAGELGHVSVDDRGHMCRCGNRGCLETMVGAAALTELLRRSHGDDITVERMVDAGPRRRPGLPAGDRRRRSHGRADRRRAVQRVQPRANRRGRRVGSRRGPSARPDARIHPPLRDPGSRRGSHRGGWCAGRQGRAHGGSGTGRRPVRAGAVRPRRRGDWEVSPQTKPQTVTPMQ